MAVPAHDKEPAAAVNGARPGDSTRRVPILPLLAVAAASSFSRPSRDVCHSNPATAPSGATACGIRLRGFAYRPPATSTAYTCVAPCMLERNTTHWLSGVIVTFGSSA